MSSLSTLAFAARAGDGVKVLEQSDIKALNRSLTNQIVGASVERIGGTRRISPMEKTLINTYGASIADAMVAKMLTADKLTEMLKTGKLEGASRVADLCRIASIGGDLPTGELAVVAGRVHLIQPVLLGIRVSDTSDPESYTAINLHFEGSDWKLAGLPGCRKKAIVRWLAARPTGEID